MNERIRAREVRLIDENGAQLGVLSVREALNTARQRELDLIEVAPNATPPVCRIMDYGKHKYQLAKREQESRKKHKPTEVRQLQFRPRIGEHDFGVKIKKLREMLAEGDKVRVNLRFRGREREHVGIAEKLLLRVAEMLGEVARVESPPRLEGRIMMMQITPSGASQGKGAGRAKDENPQVSGEAHQGKRTGKVPAPPIGP